MRVLVGRIVNTDAEVNLGDLSPLDRIIASAINAYHNTSMWKRRFAESEERKEEQRRKVRETLADSLLAVIHPELEVNKTLEEHNDRCKGMLLKVPARFKRFLPDVIQAHEFDAYNIVIIPPTKSIAKFCDPPYLVYVENKGGE